MERTNPTSFVANAFSLQMLADLNADVEIRQITKYEFDAVKSHCYSVVGHPDTAAVLGVPFNRASVSLIKGDVMYIGQLTGGRLPEGATTLPEGFSLKFLKVTIK
jgi:hypothetical protein